MKRWAQLFLCILLSAGVWTIHTLSQQYSAVVSVPVVAVSGIDGRADISTTDAVVSAQISAKGSQIASLSRKGRRASTVRFESADFQHIDGDTYSIPTANLYKYVSSLFGEGVSVESFITSDPVFSFPEASFKKVPVLPVRTISFGPQYMSLNGLVMEPDSVLVYGEVSRLEKIDHILTRSFELRDVRSSVHGSVRLEVPSGLRLSVREASYSMEVARYIEIKADVHIGTRGVPSRQELMVLPSTATAVFRCVFPTGADPTKDVDFYIDYSDFVSSRSGRCVASCSALPDNVISCHLTPEVFDCVLETSD